MVIVVNENQTQDITAVEEVGSAMINIIGYLTNADPD
jgi:hypothetical protein